MKKWYRLYGKTPEMNRMKPVDWAKGCFTTNLIHATIFSEEHANQAIEEVTVHNSMKFELREVKDLRGKEWY